MKPQKSLGRKLTPKKPLAEFLSLKNFQKTLKWYNMENKVFTKQVWLYFIYLQMYVARICRRFNTNLRIVLNTQKNPYLNQSTQKNTFQNFLAQKNPPIIPVI